MTDSLNNSFTDVSKLNLQSNGKNLTEIFQTQQLVGLNLGVGLIKACSCVPVVFLCITGQSQHAGHCDLLFVCNKTNSFKCTCAQHLTLVLQNSDIP